MKLNDALDAVRGEFDLDDEEMAELLSYLHDPTRNQPVVSVREFVEAEGYGNAKETLYPEVLAALEEINTGNYVECVLTGAIGSGKTTLALWTQAYQLYVLSTFENPHSVFDLDPASEIEIVFQSQKASLAKEVEFDRFKAMIDRMPYFQSHFMYDTNLKTQLKFPHRIIVKPISGEDTGALGQNVIGGVIDEVNFMATVEGSKKTQDGATYEQAVALYNSIARRRESRFLKQGELPGMLCLVSSKRYKGQFTDRKEEEAKTNKRIYVYDKRVWEVKPWAFSGDTFKVFFGDETRQPRIIAGEDVVAEKDKDLTIDIPVEYQHQFEADILNALRDYGGISTTAIHPFIVETEKVAECFGTVPSVLSAEWCDFRDNGIEIYPRRVVSKYEPRFAHVDLAKTGDSAGVAVGHVIGFRTIKRAEDQYEILPIVRFDLILEVRPPRGGEIIFDKVRTLFYKLAEVGMPVKWVSYDSWQSTDSIQILRSRGFVCGTVSVDKDSRAYDISKTALYDRRVYAPTHEKAYSEWVRLEKDEKKGKVDHPPTGSKDCSDAMAGVIYGITRRREVWIRHGVRPNQVPQSVKEYESEKAEEEEVLRQAKATWDERVIAAKQKNRK